MGRSQPCFPGDTPAAVDVAAQPVMLLGRSGAVHDGRRRALRGGPACSTRWIGENGSRLKGLRALMEEGMIERFAVVSCDRQAGRTRDGIAILPWRGFLDRLWTGNIV